MTTGPSDPVKGSDAATARGGLINAGGSLVGTVLTFLLVFVVTRNYGSASTGVFFGAVAAFMIVGTAMKLGAETALVMLLAQVPSDGGAAARSLLRSALVPVAAASVLAGIALYLLAPSLADLFTESARVDDFASILRVLAFFVPAWSLSLTLLGATRGSGTMFPTAVGLQIVQPALQITLVLVAAFAGWDLPTVALCWAAPMLVTAAIAAVSLRSNLPAVRAETTPDQRAQLRNDLWSFAGPRGVAGTLQMALDRVGILLVGALAPAAVAGQWAAISRLIGVAQRVFHAIGQSLNPRVSALAKKQDWSGVSGAVERMTQWTVLMLGPALLGLIIFPSAALSLFGDDFTPGASGLIVAGIAVAVSILFAHADNVLLMAGRSKIAMVNTAAALLVSVVLYLVLVPAFELVGAALALAGGIAVYRLSTAVQIHRWFGVASFGKVSLRGAGLAVIAAGIPMMIARVVWGDRLVVAIAAGVVATAIYGAGVLGFRDRFGFALSLSS